MKLRNTSASQVTAWDSCPRFWHYGWVKGFKTPPTKAMQMGTFIHAAAEELVKTSIVQPGPYAVYAEAMKPHLPIGAPRVRTEHEMWITTPPGLPNWLGYIDLLDDSRTMSPYLRIIDHKTTSDMRYNKTPQELAENTQVVSYAKWAFDNGHDEPLVEVGHLYVQTEKAEKPKRVKTLPVFTQIDRAQAEKVWARDLVLVEEMVRAAEISNTDLLPPKGTSNGHCQKYGGCPHRARCGIASEPKVKGPAMSNDFLKKLQARKAAQAAGVNPDAAPDTTEAATPPAVAAKPTVPKGVVPPDAPPRTSPPRAAAAPPSVAEEEEVDHAEPTGAAEVSAAAAPAEPKRGPGRPKKPATPPAAGQPASAPPAGFTLYINCMPTKNIHDDGRGVTLFEDWMGQVHLDLAEYAEQKGVLSWWLLPFAEQKLSLKLALDARVSKGAMPAAIAITSGAPHANEALDVLIPHAACVVKALR